MRKLLLAGVAFGALIMPAIAADVAPYYRSPPPVWGWSGFYIGANAGWVGSSGQTITNTGTDSGTGGLGGGLLAGAIPGTVNVSNSGFMGGGQVGYNWQIGPNWVWGIETDLDGASAKSSTTVAFAGSPAFGPFTTVYNSQLSVFGTLRARLGFLVTPNFLLYGTAGLAYADYKLGTAAVCPTFSQPCEGQPGTVDQISNWSFGWTAGAGVEWKFAPDWSVKAEYLYVDLGTQSDTITYEYGIHLSSLTSTVNEHDNIVRVGVNYMFGY
jgi:outer membrane immunogenic protein